MLNNIFGKKPEATPVAEQPIEAVNVQPVVTSSISQKANNFFSSIKNALFSSDHHKNMRQMMRRVPSVNAVLATDVYETIKGEDIQTLLRYRHELNSLHFDQAIKSPTYEKFYALLSPSVTARLLYLGSTINAKAGKEHARRGYKEQLIKGMREGVENALQGVGISDADKQVFLTTKANALTESLNSGSATPDQVIQEINKLNADPVLGADAQQGQVGKQLRNLKALAEQQKVDTEKDVLIEAIDGNYQTQNEKIDQIIALYHQLTALQGTNDSNVELSAAVQQEIQDITNQIIELVKELDEGSEITAAHIENPTSRNINTQQREELRTLLTHDLDKAEILLLKKTQEINSELVTRLQEIQSKRSLTRKVYDGIFNRGSKENAILAKNSKADARINALTNNIGKYEAALAARVAAAAARTWGQFGSDVLSRLNPFNKTGPSLQAQLDAAEASLNEFLSDETVQGVFAAYEKLVLDLDNVANKKVFWFSSSKTAAIGKIEAKLNEHITANLGIFETRQELVKNRDAAALAIAEANQQAEDAEEEDFVIA